MRRSAQDRARGQDTHGNILKTLWQRKWLFALIAGLVFVLIVVLALLLDKHYTAETQVLVERREQVLSNIEDIFSNLGTTDQVLNSEAEIVASDSLTRKVMSKLGLYEDPEFNAFLQEPDLLTEGIGAIKQLIVNVLGLSSQPLTEDQKRRAAEMVFQDRLDSTIIKNTRIISIQFTSTDPAETARMIPLPGNT